MMLLARVFFFGSNLITSWRKSKLFLFRFSRMCLSVFKRGFYPVGAARRSTLTSLDLLEDLILSQGLGSM